MDSLSMFLLILLACLGLGLLVREGVFKKPWLAVLCAILMAAAIALRASVFDRQTGDYMDFLARWVNYYRANGGFRAFAQYPPYCNYHVPYLYFLALFSYLPASDLALIKLLSCLFDLILAWAVMRIIALLSSRLSLRLAAFFAVLFWPTVILNGALWGQCDSIYVAFAMLAILLALEDKAVGSMICWACSFAFKLQAVFLLPIAVILWIYRKYKWQHFLVFPLAYLLLVLPAVLLGRPLGETVFFYLSQTGSIGDGLNYNSPSVFAFFWNLPAEQQENAARIGILASALALGNLLAIAWIKRKELTDRSVICLSVLMAILVPFLLPHMHDRYFFGADILSLTLAFAMPPFFLAAPLVDFASFLGYYAYLSFYFSARGGHYLIQMKYGAMALLLASFLSALAFVLSLCRKAQRKR